MSITRSGLLLATLLIVLVMAFPLVSSAQTADVQALINSLLAQVRALQAQLAALLQNQNPNPIPTQSCQLYRDLTVGSTGQDVSCLQSLLAKDPSVYPEAQISGYFGLLTQAAVQRYQLKYGLSVTGYADINTRTDIQNRLGNPIIPQPVTNITFTANPSTITAGSNSILSWSTSGMTQCTVSGPSLSYTGTAGSQSTGTLYTTSSYVINCVKTDGSPESRTATVTVNAAPSMNLVASPATVTSGGSSVITWNSQGMSSCNVTGNNFNYSGLSGNQTSGPLTITTTYTLTCTKTTGGVDTRTVTITVEQPINITLTANPTLVAYNGSATIAWNASVSGITSCSLAGGTSTFTGLTGSVSTGQLKTDTTYTLTCQKSAGGSETRTVTVDVGSQVSLTISANPTTVRSGGVSTITWSSTNATSCKVTGPGIASDGPISGSATTAGLTADSTYVLDCAGEGGSRTDKSVKVSVVSDTEIARGIIADLDKIEDALRAVLTDQSATSWWRDTSFTGSDNPTIAQMITENAAIRAKLASAPVPPTVEGGSYKYDNEADTYACGGVRSRGVNISLENVSAGVLTKLEELIDGNANANCGRMTYDGSLMLYKLSNANAFIADPVLRITAGKTTLVSGQGTVITWSATHVNSCTVTGPNFSNVAGSSGSRATGALTSDATYRLTCTSSGFSGSVSKAVRIDVRATAPTCKLTATPGQFSGRSNIKLSWTTTGATSGSINQGVGPMTPIASGSRNVSPTATTKYTATLTGPGGERSCSVTVTKTTAEASLFPVTSFDLVEI